MSISDNRRNGSQNTWHRRVYWYDFEYAPPNFRCHFIQKTLLGVDVICNGEIVVSDASEKDILNYLDAASVRIVVSPMGRQGCILGRGNQQISPRVINKVGISNVIIAATPYKLQQTPTLFVDTGSVPLDKRLTGWHQVVVGYMLAARKRVIAV